MANVRQALRSARDALAAAGVETPSLDSEVLLCQVIGCGRAGLVARWSDDLTPAQADSFGHAVRRRARREPAAYITGVREFHGLSLHVTPDVLIPRPETELLVDLALDRLPPTGSVRILDLCTGSGCVALAILSVGLAAGRDVQVVATDWSEGALEVARENARELGLLGHVQLLRRDVFGGSAEEVGVGFDVTVSNPPYIPGGDLALLQPEVSRYEPRLALDGGESGLDAISAVLRQAAACGRQGGAVLVEIGEGQSGAARAIAERTGLTVNDVHRDLAGVPRVLECAVP